MLGPRLALSILPLLAPVRQALFLEVNGVPMSRGREEKEHGGGDRMETLEGPRTPRDNLGINRSKVQGRPTRLWDSGSRAENVAGVEGIP